MTTKSRLMLSSCSLLLAGLLTSAVSQADVRPARPVEANGHLQIIGNRLSNQAGAPVRLRGVALHALQWSGWFYENPESLRAAALDWGADVLRISVYVYEGGYLDNETLKPADFDQMIERYVATCVETGIYCIIDWHVHHPGNPLYYTEQAKLFFDKYSKKYAGVPNVLYEIANEPNSTGYEKTVDDQVVTVVAPKATPWADIKSYAEQVIPVIRANDPKGVVLIGTPSWSQLGHSDGYQWQEIRDGRVQFDNTAYVIHFYADGHGLDMLDRYKAAAAALPLFATEWSPAHYDQMEPWHPDDGAPWVAWMKEAGIGGAYWMWAAGDDLWSTFDKTTTADGPFTHDGANVSPSGKYLYDWLNNPPDAWANELFDTGTAGTAGTAGQGPATGGSAGTSSGGMSSAAGTDPIAMNPPVMLPASGGGAPGGGAPGGAAPGGGALGGGAPGGGAPGTASPASGTAGTALGMTTPGGSSGCACAVTTPASSRAAWLLALAAVLGLRQRRYARRYSIK